MQTGQVESLRRVLLMHEFAFLVLVAVTGLLGGFWAYFWQQTSSESLRLNALAHVAQEVRADLFRQIKDAVVARLRDDPRGLARYSANSKEIEARFNTLRRQSGSRAEDYAIQAMQRAYRIVQQDMNDIFEDSYLLNKVVRARLLDPEYEKAILGEFEDAHAKFRGLINQRLVEQGLQVDYWGRMAPFLLPIPIIVAVLLLLFSRRSLLRGFVGPIDAIMSGTRRMSQGELGQPVPEQGVAELVEVARGINEMAAKLEATRDQIVHNERQAALGALVPVVAHNVRNPLAAIRANAQLLSHVDDAAELQERKNAIIETVDRLERWVTALVSYLHPLAPRLVMRPAAPLFEAAVGLLDMSLQEKRIRIARKPWNEQVQIEADADLLEQALYGLLCNAIEASAVDSHVGIGITVDGAGVVLTISDSAGGIPFIPEPSDLTPGPSTKRFGTGLGIPFAFKVCQAHRWVLEFDVERGVGTVVKIRVSHRDAGSRDGFV